MYRDKTTKGSRPRVSIGTVIRLDDFRKPVRPENRPLLFYINSGNVLRKKLEQISALELISIRSIPELHSALSIRTPELVLIESDLEWCDPVEVLRETQRFFEVPAVLFCSKPKSEEQKEMIRKAYKNGVYDVLFSPLKAEDLCDSLTLILRLKFEAGH